MSRPPVSAQVQVNFRMPVDLRDRIKAAADANNRSMNAEIVLALEYWLEADLPYSLALGGAADRDDVRAVAMQDWSERMELVEAAYKEELDRSIEVLKRIRHLLKVHPDLRSGDV